ncbi:unnamed protein product, partial [Prorocentrum cordatum]
FVGILAQTAGSPAALAKFAHPATAMRAVAVVVCFAVALAADPSGLEVVSDSSAVVPLTTLRGAAAATESTVGGTGDTVAAESIADSRVAGDAVATDEAAEGAVAIEASDAACASAELVLQKLVESKCGVSEVSCVYKMEGDCDDWCSPSTQCGYIQDNALVKFHDFDCSIKATSGMKVDGTIKCKPSFTTLGVLAILAAAVLALACCGGCTWFCCCRSRR